MAAATVSSKICAAHRGRLLLVAIESAVVALSAGITTFAAAVLVRADPVDSQTKVLLVLVGILGGLSWWMERAGDAASVARSIDRRSGSKGALTTAFEAESMGDSSAIAAALAREVAPVVSVRRFFGQEAWSSAAILAAPFLAIALLAAVLEGLGSSSPRERWNDLREQARGLARLPGLPAADVAALRSITDRTDRLHVHPVTPAHRWAVAESLRGLEHELAEVARRIETSRGAPSGAGVASGGQNGTMGNPAAGADRPTDGSMRDTPAPNPTPATDASAVPGSGSEGGVGSSRWWPERYDAVVERWIEARRTAADGRPR